MNGVHSKYLDYLEFANEQTQLFSEYLPEKNEQREKLSDDVEKFLARGGSITEVPAGVSAEPDLSAWRHKLNVRK